MANTTENIDNGSYLTLLDAITFMTEQRNDELYLLTDRIKLHFGTEEELIKQLRQVIKVNNTLQILKDGLETLQETLKYKIMKSKKQQ